MKQLHWNNTDEIKNTSQHFKEEKEGKKEDFTVS